MPNERYYQLLYLTMTTLETVSMANITVTNEKPGAIVRGTENNNLTLECTVNGVNTSKPVIWKQNGRPVAVGRNGSVLYSFIPMKKDHMLELCCQVYDKRNVNTIEKVITLDIKYKPVLEFNFPYKRHFIKGETNILCCSSNSRPSTKTMMLRKDQKGKKEAHHNSSICLTLMHISESDGGKYSCFAENEVGMTEQEIIITILCPPVFVEEYKIVRFGNLGEDITLKLVVQSVSGITCCHIEGENRAKRRPGIIIPKNTTHLFHGTNTIVEELEITFSFTELQTSDYQKYNITVCNHDGNSSCIVELQPMNTELEINHVLGLDVILMSLLTIILLVAGMVFALVKLIKNKRIQTPEDVVEVVEDNTEAVANVLYQSNAFRCNEATNRSTPSKSAAVSNSQGCNLTNEENQRPQRLSNRFQDLTRQLNYAEISFKPSLPGNEMRIRGLGNKTEYADVDFTNGHTSVIETLNELNSDEEDFIEIEDLEIFSHIDNETDNF
ncbi:uncharacterized protein [Mytilus edulis]|uniref:uncharacterized protein n=1 Tax=Mytilus edulis TaxID=6550 RepID=UPI0039F06EEA